MTGKITHGHTRGRTTTSTFRSWLAMRSRCENPKNERYHRYGGRGITVCQRWSSFENFLLDMGECSEGMTIDRINKDGNYEPSNCKWATPTEQANNKSNNHLIEFNGKIQTIADWARDIGVSYSKLQSRLSRGWPLDVAFSKEKTIQGIRKEKLKKELELKRNEPKENLSCHWCGNIFERKTIRSRTCSTKCHKSLVKKESYERNKDSINAKRRAKWNLSK